MSTDTVVVLGGFFILGVILYTSNRRKKPKPKYDDFTEQSIVRTCPSCFKTFHSLDVKDAPLKCENCRLKEKLINERK